MPGFWGDVADTWLGENPEAAYLGALQGWGTPSRRRRMQDQFANVYSDFAGRMYQQLLGGEVPEDDWLAQMRNPETVRGLIGQRYNRMTPYEKYGSTSRFNPQLSYRLWG